MFLLKSATYQMPKCVYFVSRLSFSIDVAFFTLVGAVLEGAERSMVTS